MGLLYKHHQQLMGGDGPQSGSTPGGSPSHMPHASDMDEDMVHAEDAVPMGPDVFHESGAAGGGMHGSSEGLMDALYNLAQRLDIEKPATGSQAALAAQLAYVGMGAEDAGNGIRVQRSAVY